MATTAQKDTTDGSEDVTDFLRRIKELSEKRDREDAERTRKLEEDILEGRRQREARRAERARSLSPEKQSPSGTPRSPRLGKTATRSELVGSSLSSSPVPRLPSSISDMLDIAQERRNTGKSEMVTSMRTQTPLSIRERADEKPDNLSRPSPGSGLSPAPAGSIPWQQRSGSLRRPVSMVDRGPSPQATEGSISDPMGISRNNIAQSLGSKDPSWFRQTPDRGINSAAYRRGQDEKEEDTQAGLDKRMLPGMSQNCSQDGEEQQSTPALDEVQLPAETTREPRPESNLSTYTPTRRGSDSVGRNSPLPLKALQRFVPSPSQYSSNEDRTTSRTTAASPMSKLDPSERHERPISPTKGMGGFVQSAMLKRSDSANKRWSVQTASGLSRQNSTASLRTGVVGIRDSPPETPKLTPRRVLKPKSTTESNDNIVKLSSSTVIGRSEDDLIDHGLVEHHRPETPASFAIGKDDKDEEVTSPPSPSKRWSPVKSSWLESALSRPSSPKLTPSSPQPSWMSELNKNKQQRSSRDVTPSTENLETAKPIRPGSSAPIIPVGNDTTLANSSTKTPPTKSKPTLLSKKPTPDAIRITDQAESIPTEDGKLADADEELLRDRTPSLTKAKPERPSRKDFTLNLKPLGGSAETAKKGELEFQNAFGKLRRTHTEKHATPNELKDNILRGKAGLSMTEGPQLPTRKDEQKETLLKQRDSLKAKPENSNKPDRRPEITSNRLHSAPPEVPAKKKVAMEINSPSGNIVSPSNTEAVATAESRKEQRQLPAEPGMLPFVNRIEPASNSKLADGFIPALASVLAKGPASKADGAMTSAVKTPPTTSRIDGGVKGIPAGETAPSEPLQHMTKSRARGPKRRLPNAETEAISSRPHALPVRPPSSLLSTRRPSLRDVTSSFSTSPKDQKHPVIKKQAKPQTPPKSLNISRKSESPQGEETSSATAVPRSPLSPPLPSRPVKPSGLRSSIGTPSDSSNPNAETRTIEQERLESNRSDAEVSVKSVSAVWGRRAASTSSPAPGPKAQITLPTRTDEQALMENAGLSRGDKTANGRVGPSSALENPTLPSIPPSTSRGSAHDRPVKPLNTEKSPPPKIGVKPSLVDNKASEVTSNSSLSVSLRELPESQAIGRYFNNFFKKSPTNDTKLDVDTHAVLSAGQAGPDKIQKLRMHISELSSDGKSTPLPSHQDHVLFDSSVYLCTHVFGDHTGARVTEVYLWAGNSVAEATLEDTQVFARKAAKECGARLVIFRRGKETSNFFQALGGILITRSGSAQQNKKSYMLCGRRHLGHLAFDEVEFSTASLCSAFPFIIASSSNTVFLWKGSGCNAEELAGARLMSMDLGILGRVVEIDEGQETSDFFAAFPASSNSEMLPSTNHWELKAKSNGYNVRLFRVERLATQESYTMSALWNRVRRPSQPDNAPMRTEITEIVPFCQADIEPENVYLLDAFFELYVILGPLARSKSDAFAVALLFAQDYAILAASTEDRPYVPRGMVVLEGMPRNVKVVFRQWDDGQMSTGALMAGRPKSGAGLKVVSLNEAITAITL